LSSPDLGEPHSPTIYDSGAKSVFSGEHGKKGFDVFSGRSGGPFEIVVFGAIAVMVERKERERGVVLRWHIALCIVFGLFENVFGFDKLTGGIEVALLYSVLYRMIVCKAIRC
jgi:hypothetical protein